MTPATDRVVAIRPRPNALAARILSAHSVSIAHAVIADRVAWA
ncbi:MAG: hypothetical protein U0326_09495 [Polyangiales bacterium]